jgi:hypothetical protein
MAVIPFAVVVISVLAAIILIDWFNNRRIGDNLMQVALATNGELEKDGNNYTLKGAYCGRQFTIYMKPRGAGKNKAVYYHVHLESESDMRMVCLKQYVKSRLDARINEMEPLDIPDEDFSMVHRILVDNKKIGQSLIDKPHILEAIKKIMEKYTEMSIKKDITLLKRYHVKLTEPEILLATLENLIKIAVEVENLCKTTVK